MAQPPLKAACGAATLVAALAVSVAVGHPGDATRSAPSLADGDVLGALERGPVDTSRHATGAAPLLCGDWTAGSDRNGCARDAAGPSGPALRVAPRRIGAPGASPLAAARRIIPYRATAPPSVPA